MSVRLPRGDHGAPDPGAPDRRARDRGETLIELLVTISIMGLAVVAVLGAVATSILLSTTHRKQAAAGAYVRSFAEAVESKVTQPDPNGYKPCATASSYASAVPNLPAPYSASITDIAYWKSATSSFSGSCGTDEGIQRISLKVATSDNKVVETLVVIVRQPCRPTDSACS